MTQTPRARRYGIRLVLKAKVHQADIPDRDGVIFGLASYLWTTEYRDRHFPSAPVSQA